MGVLSRKGLVSDWLLRVVGRSEVFVREIDACARVNVCTCARGEPLARAPAQRAEIGARIAQSGWLQSRRRAIGAKAREATV